MKLRTKNVEMNIGLLLTKLYVASLSIDENRVLFATLANMHV